MVIHAAPKSKWRNKHCEPYCELLLTVVNPWPLIRWMIVQQIGRENIRATNYVGSPKALQVTSLRLRIGPDRLLAEGEF